MVCRHEFTRPVGNFFYHFELEMIALILTYNILVTKKIFFRNKHQKKKIWPQIWPRRKLTFFKSGLSKKLSNISLKVTIEKKWRNQKFDLLSLKNSSPGQILGDFQLTQMFLNSQSSCCNLQIRVLGAKLCVAFLLF